MTRKRCGFLTSVVWLVLLFVTFVGMSVTLRADGRHQGHVRTPGNREPMKQATDFLVNVIQVHPHVFSGGVPECDEAFSELRQLGVQTVISVDGAAPDTERARKFGLRYVRLPHGYDTISLDRSKQLAKAVRDLKGPIYIHCHHGQHRSPAAAAVACIGAGLVPRSYGARILELGGTGREYRGLFRVVELATPFSDEEIDEIDVQIFRSVPVPTIVESMVAMQRSFDRIQRYAKSNWQTKDNDPEHDPKHQLVVLREHIAELLRSDDARLANDDFRGYLSASVSQLFEIEQTLAGNESAGGNATLETLKSSIRGLAKNCQACHHKFRDNP